MKVLNLYPGIGGNRKLWTGMDITAVELDPEIAAIYREYFPHDTVIEGDAHEYLLNNYKNFDFIWSSPPCQTHSRARQWATKGGRYAAKFPDMKLWQEIIFLQGFCDVPFVVENVKPYYEPLIKPTIEIDRHLFWANFKIKPFELNKRHSPWSITGNSAVYGFDISGRKMKHRKDQIIRNLVNPEIGAHILNCAFGNQNISKPVQSELFA